MIDAIIGKQILNELKIMTILLINKTLITLSLKYIYNAFATMDICIYIYMYIFV